MIEAASVINLSQPDVSLRQNALVDEGRLADAENVLKLWLPNHDRDDKSHIADLDLGRVLFWRGKPTEAKDRLNKSLQKKPDETWSLSMMGQVEARMGNYDVARTLFEQALALNPQNDEALRFLTGDVMDQEIEVKRLLTHGKLSPRNRIKVLELCAAIDFKRNKKINLELDEFTQQAFNRENLILDSAQVGDEVDSELSLRGKFNEAEEVVYYTSQAFGDAVLGLSIIQAMARYFDRHPDKRKPVEIVTPFAEIFEGLSEKYPFVRIKKLGKPRSPNEAEDYSNDLKTRQKKIFVLTNSGTDVFKALFQAKKDNSLAVVDAFVDRYSRDLVPWHSINPPSGRISSYPAKMYRFFEMLIGEKLINYPPAVAVELPVSRAMQGKNSDLMRKYGLSPQKYYCVNESASQIAKKFSQEQLKEILTRMTLELQNEDNISGGGTRKIVFLKDPGAKDSFAAQVSYLPPEVKNRIVVADENLFGVAGLALGAKSILSPDTGIAHLASALGRKTLIIHTMADPYLWNAGGSNVEFLASPQALEAHDNLTPVNMIEWNSQEPITQHYFTAQDIVNRWKALTDKRILGQP